MSRKERKAEYREKARVSWAAAKILDDCTPSTFDDDSWEKYEAAVKAVREFASHMYSHPFNPALAEAKRRGDYERYSKQLRERPPISLNGYDVLEKEIEEALEWMADRIREGKGLE